MKFDWKQILDLAKRRWVVLSLCAVMIIAIVARFTFVSSQQVELQKDLDKRKQLNDKMNSLLSKVRHQPVVSPDPDAARVDLKPFPNPGIIEAGQAAIQQVQQQSLQLKNLALNMNTHTLLVPDSLPLPRDVFRFKEIYLQQFSKVIPALLQSATPPTEEQIKAQADKEAARLTAEAPQNKVTGEVFNKEALAQQIARRQAQLPEEMRVDAATKHKLYMAPAALSMQPELAGGAGTVNVAPDAEKIWYAQMGLWVQTDVVQAIANINRSSKKVEDSPVKQLLQIAVPADANLYAVPGAAPGGSAAPAMGGGPSGPVSAVPTLSENDPFPRDYAIAPTGRVCNGAFDVVHFMISVHVQAADIGNFIQELQRDRLLTVYQTDIQAVNSVGLQQQGFYYGKNGVVLLTLACEELFIRDWTHKLMPDAVKKYLNVDQTADANAGQPVTQ